MNQRYRPLCAAATLAVAITTPSYADGVPAAGQQLYATRCAACHSLEFNSVGPTHRNLIGRRAGTVPGFTYSQALKDSGVAWNQETLSRWLADPEKFIPGQKMFVSVPDARERADIVAYLLLVAGPQRTQATKTGE
jgi:cytochrome c